MSSLSSLKPKVFLTGGTGTLGKEIIKRFHKKWDIISYSRDELKLSHLEREYPDVKFVIGDIKDYPALEHAMKGCHAIIHAAAMKRIEVCEMHPMEAIKTNILGAHNVVMAALKNGVTKAVVTGSDKGVEPVNAYGATKFLQEKIFSIYNFNSVRYGNVFGSRGSVAPLFVEQAKKGIALTVTHPEMTRFILTIDDAVNLILFALEQPMDGTVFVKKSPSVRLVDLASAFSDKVKFTGKTQGEKLHESLINPEEFTRIKEFTGGYMGITKTPSSIKYGERYSSDNERLLTVKEIKALAKKYLQ